jgi:hypothetical protein
VIVKNLDMLEAESAAVTTILLTEYIGSFFLCDSKRQPQVTKKHPVALPVLSVPGK